MGQESLGGSCNANGKKKENRTIGQKLPLDAINPEQDLNENYQEIKERIMKRYETKRIEIEKLLTLGYTTSGDP